MLRKMIQGYKKLMDEKIGNGTLIVSIIALLIVAMAYLIPNSSYLKANALEAKNESKDEQYFTIDGKTYNNFLEEIETPQK